MKQLLHMCENLIVAGLNDHAFLVQNSSICELLPPLQHAADNNKNEPTHEGGSKNESSKGEMKQDLNDPNPHEVQAVAVARWDDKIWCAVSRYNKTLSLYCLVRQESLPSIIPPTTIHKTKKRVLCLAFGSIPSEKSSSEPLHVVIAGDLVGDASAYSLTDSSLSQVLLGHTASMLTGLEVLSSRILTCDRDEKIRVSSFPQTFVIEGYLLGHTAFITSMDATGNKCISCGGDACVRLWNFVEFKQLAEYRTQQGLLPTRVAVSPNAMHAAVIYDASNKLDVLTTNDGSSLEIHQPIECPSQPLSVKFVSDERFLVLSREPEYMMEYKLQDSQFVLDLTSTASKSLKNVASSRNIAMPLTIMEVDLNSGQLKLQKEAESRGAKAGIKPWNKVERVQKAKDASKRREKRRRQAEVQENTDDDK